MNARSLGASQLIVLNLILQSWINLGRNIYRLFDIFTEVGGAKSGWPKEGCEKKVFCNEVLQLFYDLIELCCKR